MTQRKHPHGSPEWVANNCDPQIAFERTVQRTLSKLLEQRNRAEAVLAQIVGQEKPNKYGYDACGVALQDDWREEARQLLADIRAGVSSHE